MIELGAAQSRNLAAVLPHIVDRAVRERVAFAGWTESGWRNLANDGMNTSHSPGVTPEIAEILRRSLDLPHDGVGSNGRSTGVMQQTSTEVGGSWGDMVGTMIPRVAAARFQSRLSVTGSCVFVGWLLQPDGSKRQVVVTLSSPIAADVLQVQQPLADEAESDNYGAAQVAVAVELSARFAPPAPHPAAYLDQLLGRQ